MASSSMAHQLWTAQSNTFLFACMDIYVYTCKVTISESTTLETGMLLMQASTASQPLQE